MNRVLLLQRISRGAIATTAGALFRLGFARFGYVAVAPLAIGTLFLLWVSVNARPVSYTHLTLPTTPYV